MASAIEDQFKNKAVEFNAVTVNTGGGRVMGVAIGNIVDENELESAGRLEESRKLVEDTDGKTDEVEMDLTVDIESNIVYNEAEGFCIMLCEDVVLVLIKLVRSVSCERSNTIVGNIVDENELESAGRLEESRKLVEDTDCKTDEVEMDLTVDIESNIVYNEAEGFRIMLCEDVVLVLIKLVRSVSCERSNTIVDIPNIYVDISTEWKDLVCEGTNLLFTVMVAVMRGRDV